MTKALGLLLVPLAAHGQLVLYSINSSVESPLGPSYDLGRVAQGDIKDVRLRVRNIGAAAAVVTSVSVNGAGFSVAGNTPTLPYTIAPGNFLDIAVRFSAGPPASYSAHFQVNGANTILLASSVVAPVLTVFPSCTIPDRDVFAIDFGRVQRGQFRPCSFYLRNPSAAPMILSVLSVAGDGFEGPSGLQIPRTLAPGETVSFTVRFAPTAAALYAADLIVETRSYRLTGAGVDPPLPPPTMQFDTPAVQSAEQRALSMRFSAPVRAAARGFLNLSFDPDTSVVRDDPAVVFVATGTRSIPFSVAEGDTQALLNGEPTAVIQTGTTAGRFRFTLSGVAAGIEGNPTSVLVVPPAPIEVDRTTATRRPGTLDVHVIGYDNTYTAGGMSFTFYDTAGGMIGGGAIRTDFTAEFRAYFTTARAGSAFLLLVVFPVSGDAGAVASVDVTMTNTAGTVTRRLTFQ
jgi:hypothetical protein